jgi:predicted flap endonuclease-1-like 5' DNA nuclease
MTDRTAYRQRVATVRGRARAQLAAIRKERLARMRTGSDTTDPLAAAWVADQLSDAGVPTDAPEHTPKLALVAPAHDEEIEAGGGAEASAAECGARQAEDGDADFASGTAGRQQEAGAPDEGATDTDAREAMMAPPDDPVDPALVGAPPPTVPPADTEPGAADAPAAASDVALAPDVTDVLIHHSGPGPQDGKPAAHRDEPAATPEPPLPADDAPRLAVEPLAEKPLVEETSNLSEIPGIGPGLVWMLREAGVGTLEDLARAEASDLARKLGTIGRLLDLDWFIDFARGRTQAR